MEASSQESAFPLQAQHSRMRLRAQEAGRGEGTRPGRSTEKSKGRTHRHNSVCLDTPQNDTTCPSIPQHSLQSPIHSDMEAKPSPLRNTFTGTKDTTPAPARGPLLRHLTWPHVLPCPDMAPTCMTQPEMMHSSAMDLKTT